MPHSVARSVRARTGIPPATPPAPGHPPPDHAQPGQPLPGQAAPGQAAVGQPESGDSVIADRAHAEGYLAKVCFKTGPPRRLGIELEWTVHHTDDPTRPLDPAALATALGPHAPPSLRPDSPHRPLPHGGAVTVEPGGQVEISTAPGDSLADLCAATAADIDRLRALLDAVGLRLGTEGCDPYRPARRVLFTARYAAMEQALDLIGPHGRVMMCGTAGLQVCLDVGTANRVAARWTALHPLGPVLLAVFANSHRYAGRRTGWASHRMHTWYGTDPPHTLAPPVPEANPIAAWSRRVLNAPPMIVAPPMTVRDEHTRPPSGRDEHTRPMSVPDRRARSVHPAVSFADWIAGAPGAPDRPPTYADLDLHCSTLFPPVRARGYFEVRYLDTQPGDGWLTPVAVLAALFAREETVDAASALAAEAADRWVPAARHGLADPVIGAVAPAVLDLARAALNDTDLPPNVIARVADRLRVGSRTGGTSRTGQTPRAREIPHPRGTQ